MVQAEPIFLFFFFSLFFGPAVDDATTLVRFLLGGIMLAGAVIYDVRERRVPNPWWIPFAWLGAVLVVGDLLAVDDAVLLGLRYGMTLVLGSLVYLFWRMHLFGGADAKAILVLALLAPWPPSQSAALLPALDALANGALFMLAIPLGFLVVNVVRGHVQFPAAFLGVRRPLAWAREAFVWPMQVASEAGLRWRYWQRLGGDLDREFHALERQGVTEVWVTPKVPFLVPLLAGWVVAGWHGNLLLTLAHGILGP